MTHAMAAPAFFAQIVALLVAGTAVAYIGYRLGLVPIVGFLLAGVLIGPHAFGLVQRPELVDAAAEAGVILLLFTIGIEFNLEKLATMRRVILIGGGLQVLLATLATVVTLRLLGVALNAAVFTGLLVALSSTAIVLKLLADRGETDVESGRIAIGILIFQDLAVIVMVLFVPILGGVGGSTVEIAWALLRAAAIIAVVLVFARRLMPGLLEVVARTCAPEIFLLTVVAICFGTAYVTSLAGVSLSLGAFLAGLLVSESKFSEHALGEILPLQILFSATFFVSVGMLLDLGFVMHHLPIVLATSVAVLFIKLITTTLGVRALGYSMTVAAAAALTVSQVGEFSFVLERTGRAAGLFPAGLDAIGSQSFIAATVLLMVISPQLAQLAARISGRHVSDDVARDSAADLPIAGPVQLRDHVIVAGYGQGARVLVQGLDRARVAYAITTLSPQGADEAEAEGRVVLRGDATRSHMLDLAGIEHARAIVIADDDAATARRIAAVARVANSNARIIVRTRFAADVPLLQRAGSDHVVAEETASAVAMLHDVLASYDVPVAQIEAIVAAESQPVVSGQADAAAAGGAGGTVVQAVYETSSATAASRCTHLDQIDDVKPRTPQGCEECLRSGERWVHLRLCLTCGHVGCCDSSPNRHATGHFHATTHPIIRSFQPGEDWRWCYVDQVVI